jgi:hypothetical protein
LLEAAEASRLHAFIVLCLLTGFGRRRRGRGHRVEAKLSSSSFGTA